MARTATTSARAWGDLTRRCRRARSCLEGDAVLVTVERARLSRVQLGADERAAGEAVRGLDHLEVLGNPVRVYLVDGPTVLEDAWLGGARGRCNDQEDEDAESIRLAPGVRLNVTKRGLGVSAGAGGVRYSAHSSGRRTVSARSGIPGVTYQKTVSGGQRTPASRRRGAPQLRAPQAQPSAPSKPGLFAPKGENQLYKSIRDDDVKLMKQVGEEHEDFRVPAWSFAAIKLMNSEPAVASQLLEAVFATGRDPSEHPFVVKYLATHLTLNIAQGVTAELPINRDAVGLALAELRQEAGNIPGAIDVVEQLEPTTYAAVSLAELYIPAGRYADVVELTDGMHNEDDATALLLCFRSTALREEGHNDAAHEALKEALRSRSRAAPIRHHALAERAATSPNGSRVCRRALRPPRSTARSSSREPRSDITATAILPWANEPRQTLGASIGGF